MSTPAASVLQPSDRLQRGIRTTLWGVAANGILVGVKFVAGLVGNSYALVADAAESLGDVVSSLIVLGGLKIAARQPDEKYPYGYGRAETLAAAAVALMLIVTAFGIGWAAIHEIRTPHEAPASWTLIVLVVVIAVKWAISRMVSAAGQEIESRSVQADAWHHLSDAVTSGAAFIGIAVALWMGKGWEAADDWAALFAAGIIVANGCVLLRGAVRDLMDRAPSAELENSIRATAASVPEVRAIEKLTLRRTGLNVFVDIHVQADPQMPLEQAHSLGGAVKAAIQKWHPTVTHVLVHMEPFHGNQNTAHEKAAGAVS